MKPEFFTVLFSAFAYWHIIFQFIFFSIVINFLIIIVIVVEIIIPLKVVCRLKVLIEIFPCKCWPAGKIKHIYENLQRSQIRIYQSTHHATNRIAPGVRGLDWRVLPLNQIAEFVEYRPLMHREQNNSIYYFSIFIITITISWLWVRSKKIRKRQGLEHL